MWGFGIGLLLPFLPWLGNRIWPSQQWRLVNMPLLTFANSPGATNSFILPVAVVGFICQFCMRRFRREWFDKFNYILSISLDSAASISIMVFTLMVCIWPTSQPHASLLAPQDAPDYYCFEGPLE